MKMKSEENSAYVETVRLSRCSFSYVITRTGPLRILRQQSDSCWSVLSAFGRKGWLSVSRVFGSQRRDNALVIILSFFAFSVSVFCAHVLDSFITPRLVSLASLDCAFCIPIIFLC